MTVPLIAKVPVEGRVVARCGGPVAAIRACAPNDFAGGAIGSAARSRRARWARARFDEFFDRPDGGKMREASELSTIWRAWAA